MTKSKNERTTRKIRYWLFRFRTEAEGGSISDGAPEGLREKYESHPAFETLGGWKKFAAEWDIDPNNPDEIIPRSFSIHEEWNRELIAHTKLFPLMKKNDGDGNV